MREQASDVKMSVPSLIKHEESQQRPNMVEIMALARTAQSRAPEQWQIGTRFPPRKQVKPQLEEKEGKTFDVFTAVEFKTQVVAGTNYFIKVHVGNDEFMHLRVFRSLPHENKPLSLHSYQSSKAKHDELTFF
ncbi:hypothetical protein llap_12622 [Limosa lapponica baueri]|uniref:Cystatin domain-containing protein n=1 Tax=Limosa lapponica baueri TaxID=1758121 RepID=A0A2I0TTG5_LIMLA|nr:hypothetical protein llap_12622 [Limosa lapponica baueri]